MLIFAKIADGAREPKIDPKMSPTSSPKPPPEASTWLKLSLQGGASFSSKFQLKIERFGVQNGTKNHSKIGFGANWEPPGGLRGLQGPSGSLRGAIFEPGMLQNHVKYVALRLPVQKFTVSEPPNHRKIRGFGASEPPKPWFGCILDPPNVAKPRFLESSSHKNT